MLVESYQKQIMENLCLTAIRMWHLCLFIKRILQMFEEKFYKKNLRQVLELLTLQMFSMGTRKCKTPQCSVYE